MKTLPVDPNNLLRLTAESHPKFSATLAEACLKVTYESPPGIKRNLQRTIQVRSASLFVFNISRLCL